MDAAAGVTRGSAEEVRVSGRRANGAQARCLTAAPRSLQALPEPMTLFRRSTRPWASVRVLSQCG